MVASFLLKERQRRSGTKDHVGVRDIEERVPQAVCVDHAGERRRALEDIQPRLMKRDYVDRPAEHPLKDVSLGGDPVLHLDTIVRRKRAVVMEADLVPEVKQTRGEAMIPREKK